ncbi:MAG: transposase [Spirochaetes bacterium]|nr:transposase [Spirochaetota bacterium]
MLKNFRVIDHKTLLEYRKAYPKGFYVDVRFKATYDNPGEREKMAQYLIRQPIGDNRITKYDPIEKQVKIWYKGELDQETGRHLFRSEKIDVSEFIARRIQHILPPYFQKVRFMGIYSNKYRGQHKEKVKEFKPDSRNIPGKDWNSSWRRLIWKIYDRDPLCCTTCGTEMRIKEVYTGQVAEQEIKKLIHLKYYIRGRWMIEKRKECLGPVIGKERRKIA